MTTKERLSVVEAGVKADIDAELANGYAVAFITLLGYASLKARMADRYPHADCWYTERNGDPICLLVPKGTPSDRLPDHACGYWVFEWIDPDGEFGVGAGVCPQEARA